MIVETNVEKYPLKLSISAKCTGRQRSILIGQGTFRKHFSLVLRARERPSPLGGLELHHEEKEKQPQL